MMLVGPPFGGEFRHHVPDGMNPMIVFLAVGCLASLAVGLVIGVWFRWALKKAAPKVCDSIEREAASKKGRGRPKGMIEGSLPSRIVRLMAERPGITPRGICDALGFRGTEQRQCVYNALSNMAIRGKVVRDAPGRYRLPDQDADQSEDRGGRP